MNLCFLLFFLFLAIELFSSLPPSKPLDWDYWTFCQKIIWRGGNLDPRIPYASLVDKLEAKTIVRDSILTAQVFFATNNPAEIFIDQLPETFIMKPNNASGRGIIVKKGEVVFPVEKNGSYRKCTDQFLRFYAKKWLESVYAAGSEKQYGLIQPMVFFEEYLENLTMEIELYFFNGKMRLISLYINQPNTVQSVDYFYDENWKLLLLRNKKLLPNNFKFKKPAYVDRLITFGEYFAKKIDHVRIDFFIREEEVYFGEFTFTTGGGGFMFLNSMIGDYWDFPDSEQ